ncbi:T9SS type A sorting domain-containing protein [Flavivirga algicola]|uniref:T9SS type A sorting domain-containing protein n=1 Tax=Flavivirga algicola TaxID=2729136 RepID=A0ABX1S126_9FLAO|nr:T9SS type A sorting domain-containing protein [Flavivirga algicola]NMH89577.1 T9SS type A sorting domain-containing protein [Flavivirga algicola]
MKTIMLFLIVSLLNFSTLISQVIDVSIHFDHKQMVGGVDTFERSKFITLHSANYEQLSIGQQALMDYLINDLEVYYGRETGAITGFGNQYPNYSNALNSWKNSYINNTTAHTYEDSQDLVVAGQYNLYDVFVSNASNDYALAGKNYGAFISDYLSDATGTGGVNGMPRPGFIELLNEPLWEQIDKYRLWLGGGPSQSEEIDILNEIFLFHKEAAKEIHSQFPEIKVGGFAEAFPDPELNNFFNWDTRWKTFIDNSGADMDFYSFHIYDLHCLGSDQKYRKGGNLEALMDLISHYNHLALGEEKPFLITEYGGRAHCHEGSGTRTQIHDWLFTSSINSLMMQFMDRTDMIEKAIPFMMAVWTPEWNIFRLDLPNKDVFSDYIKFFELWEGVNGTRLVTETSDLDLQVDAYTHGNKTYLILNNIDDNDVTVGIDELGILETNITGVTSRHFHYDNSEFKLDTANYNSLPGNLTVGGLGTMILVYTTTSAPEIEFTSVETRNYATAYKKGIQANTPISFNINNLVLGTNGSAILRLGLGRAHNLSLQPTVTMNGSTLTVPSDFRGDVQTDKGSFFGMLELEVPYNVLEENNIVNIEFPDSGGYVTSAMLRLFNLEAGSLSTEEVTNSPFDSVKIYPNPSTNQIIIDSKDLNGVKYEIYSLQGKIITKGALKGGSINLSSFNGGVYILKLRKDNHVSIKRVVKL